MSEEVRVLSTKLKLEQEGRHAEALKSMELEAKVEALQSELRLRAMASKYPSTTTRAEATMLRHNTQLEAYSRISVPEYSRIRSHYLTPETVYDIQVATVEKRSLMNETLDEHAALTFKALRDQGL